MFLINLIKRLRWPKLAIKFSMWNTFYIKANEIGILSNRGDFQQFLKPGKYTYFGRDWQVKTYDLNQPEAQIENLELLLRERQQELEEYLTIVRTDFDRVALVRIGRKWMSIAPDRLVTFWRGFIDVEAHMFNLEDSSTAIGASSLELPAEFVRQLRGVSINGLKKFQIADSEVGLLYIQNNFIRVLEAGEYAFWAFDRDIVVKTFNPTTQPEAKIDNLELLLRSHATELEEHLLIVKTEFNQAALVRADRFWYGMAPNQIRAVWKRSHEVESHVFNLEESLELPGDFVQRLREVNIGNIKKFEISESQLGLLYIQDNFIRPLTTGEYAFWAVNRDINVPKLDRMIPNPPFPQEELLIEKHPDFVRDYCTAVQLADKQVAIVRYLGKVIAILPPTTRKLFWQGVEVETIDISEDAKLSTNLIAELGKSAAAILVPSGNSLHICEVPAQHTGLLYIDRAFKSQLEPGIHAWWVFGRSFQTEVFDLRLQNLEVSGQDILSKDKVPLRLNLTAGFRIQDILRAKSALSDINSFLYKELQFALRAAVGEQTLDALLENKGAIDRSVADYIRTKTAEYGIEIDSVGVKDIILPGEIKTILSKVVEAEKAAQANVVRRREETAATRSMLNTAKVMEDNPVALRLKELEVLERIAEKIDRIQVNGSLDSILTDLIKIDRQSSN
jgi:regulator of protease activity HflC (stomatin/prohibitin superfamily)